MEAVFLKLLNMSITASWLVLAVVLLRLLLKKAPKAIAVVLWAMVGIRLICPFSIESVLSLIPSAETVPQEIIYAQSPQIQSGVPVINAIINPALSGSFAPSAEHTSVNPIQVALFIASVLWLMGMTVMLLYTLISYLRVRVKVREAVPLKENIFLCDRIDTPFILGVIRPRIFLPSTISGQDMAYVIAHEKAHLKRRDHWWKPLGFLLLTVYWFNPVLWVAYVILCKDIELACDEKVIRVLGTERKKEYSIALINCSVPRKLIAACPLAFGELGVKGRIKSVLHYKKPAVWVIVAAVVVCVVVAVCFLTNPAGVKLYERAEDDVDYVQSVTVGTGGNTYELVSNVEIEEVLNFMSSVRVGRSPISNDRSEDRDRSHSISLQYETYVESFYFSADYSEVWINDSVKPSKTTKVQNPEDVKTFLNSLFPNNGLSRAVADLFASETIRAKVREGSERCVWTDETTWQEVVPLYDCYSKCSGYVYILETDGQRTGYMQINDVGAGLSTFAYSFEGIPAHEGMADDTAQQLKNSVDQKLYFFGNFTYCVRVSEDEFKPIDSVNTVSLATAKERYEDYVSHILASTEEIEGH